ncbi:ionotropic glutamate receptor, putative, partial [Ixodes scapularis]
MRKHTILNVSPLKNFMNVSTSIVNLQFSSIYRKFRREGSIIFMLRFSGLTGPVFLDPFGRRYNLTLHVLQLKKAGLASIGSWSPESGLKITRTASMVQEEIMETLQNKTFKITTLINAPYVMLKKSAPRLSGNDRFEGFCVDLVREMSRLLGFRYQLRLVRDGSYGTRNRDGRWNGMVREIIDR